MNSSLRQIARRLRGLMVARRLPRNPFPVPASPYHATTFVIGDSHVSLFGGLDRIQPIWPSPSLDVLPDLRSFHLGPVLAYNLDRYGSSSLGRERMEAVLTYLPPSARVLLSFGEIDCRVHLLKNGPSAAEANARVKACQRNFLNGALRLKQQGHKVSIYNVIPSTPNEHWSDAEYPTNGTCLERNTITRQLNQMLMESCHIHGIGFLSSFDHFVDSKGQTDPAWLMDHVHLSQAALPITLAAGSAIFSDTQESF